MNEPMIAFLPCRLGSERVKRKNIRPFCGIEGGLLSIKLRQLLATKSIDEIVFSSNDPEALSLAESFDERRIKILPRPDHLGQSSTSTDSLIEYVPSIIHEGHVLWTHVTSPFINSEIYESAIEAYFKLDPNFYDSLMSVTALKKFFWSKEGPINYAPKDRKWPRTQDLSPVYEINSGFFLSRISNYIAHNDRIGLKPYLYQLDRLLAQDIDDEEDFELCEYYWNKAICHECRRS